MQETETKTLITVAKHGWQGIKKNKTESRARVAASLGEPKLGPDEGCPSGGTIGQTVRSHYPGEDPGMLVNRNI